MGVRSLTAYWRARPDRWHSSWSTCCPERGRLDTTAASFGAPRPLLARRLVRDEALPSAHHFGEGRTQTPRDELGSNERRTSRNPLGLADARSPARIRDGGAPDGDGARALVDQRLGIGSRPYVSGGNESRRIAARKIDTGCRACRVACARFAAPRIPCAALAIGSACAFGWPHPCCVDRHDQA